jgi:signal transduction histidine kinase
MKTHKEVIGALQAVNKRENEKYNDTDVNALTTLASLAGLAIENARLFRQSDFVAEMVHELRTPLLSLKTSTTLLLRPDLPEEKRTDMVIMMQNETNRLMSLTTEFLDLAQMESGRAKIEIAPFDLNKLLEESIHVVTPQASDKDINVINNNQSELKVSGDRGKIKQVLLNLLTNAIKYNRKDGSIYVNTEVVERDEVPMMRIAVQDTGYGIPKEDQKHMFQKFFRVQSTADKASGTGLGLVITKHIVEAHGGNIWLESESGVGTTFFFTIPVLE